MTLEERIKQMLEESTKQVAATSEVVAEETKVKLLSLSEEDLDAMTQEEFDSIDEEQLDELSKKTLGSYMKKADADIDNNTHYTSRGAETDNPSKYKNRAKMINTAGSKRLAKDTTNYISKIPNSTSEFKSTLKNAAKTNKHAYSEENAGSSSTRDQYAHSQGKNKHHAVINDAKSKVEHHVEWEDDNGDINKHSVKYTKHDTDTGHTNEGIEVSSQVASLLEAEGLSEEFKVQAVTIFEAAVTDRVLQIQEELETEYNEKLDEAKAEIETNIDGFLNEVVQQWANNNEVAIQSNFKTRLAESFMDGLQSLLAEHNIDLPAESEDALEIALDQVNKLEEQAEEVQDVIAQLQEQVNELKAEKILESFKEKMTSTEFDRFAQLSESVKFKDETQYQKQLNIVLENFGKITKKHVNVESTETVVEQIVEDSLVQSAPVVTESFNSVNRYAQYLASKAK